MFLTELWGQAGGAGRIAWRARSAVLATGALAALGAIAGCASDGGVDTEVPVAASGQPVPQAGPTAGPTASASSSPDEDAVLAAYREFFARQTEISAAPDDERRDLLEPFTTDPALDRVLRGMFAAEDLGEVGYGAAVLRDPTVEIVDADKATVTDCQDTSDTGRKKRDGGKVTTRGLDRDHVEATMRLGQDGAWRVASVDYLDEPC